MNVYFISGLGADRQAFEKLTLPESFSLYYLDWIKNNKGESLNSYARRLAGLIDTTQPFAVVGLSMGGMVAAAMIPFLPPHKTILISSVASTREFPPLLKLTRLTRADKLVPAFVFHQPNRIAYWLFGARSKNEKRIMQYIISRSDPRFVKWSVGAIVGWEMKQRPAGLFHIHGEKDRILPIRYTKPDAVIRNGSHFMVWTKAREVSRLLTRVLETDGQASKEQSNQ